MEPYDGQEPYIFISYARKDKERVTPFLDALSGAGYRVWYDKGIKAGEHWTETLVEKVEACAVFCPLFSEAFNASRFCFEETEYAYRKDKPIVPAYLEELKPDDLRPLYRLLASRQHLRLDDYNPAQFAERLEREQAFALCKIPEWNKIGEIQWCLDANGILSIARNPDLPDFYDLGSIPPYQYDPVYKCGTAPWMSYRAKILSVEILDNVDVIGNNAFCGCESLKNVHIGDGVTVIGSAFAGCKSLTNVCIPNSVTIIGYSAFEGCASLTDVRIPDSVTAIGDLAFAVCNSLRAVRIPDSVTKIGNFAFALCESLTDVHIGDGVTEIGNYAFADCENLTSVEIPAQAKVGVEAFPNETLVTRRDAP